MYKDINEIIAIEKKWQKKWEISKCFEVLSDSSKPLFYNLVEFPFPSGAGFHAGHMLAYSGMDVIARYKRRQGFNVLFPMGFDSLGISAENYATKLNKHPSVVVEELKKNYIESVKSIGWSVDPNSHIATSDKEFIKWTQWIFIQFFKAGLAYKSNLAMNWCPNCRTTLTNEELEEGKCNRCHGKVEKKEKLQWNLKMTKYADRLIDDLKDLDFPERVKRDQINWIGKSIGAEVDFKAGDDILTVYTTRIDTIYGVSFCVMSPEHKLVKKWLDCGLIKNKTDVENYIKKTLEKSEIERTDLTKEKTGTCLDGINAINPFSKKSIPVFISDYVLPDYGCGAVMAVPAHDSRDFAFANKFNLEIIPVLESNDSLPYEGDGVHINSGFLDGLDKENAIKKAIEYSKENGDFVRPSVRYRLKDWGFSRQMYWGEPIPLVYCEKCGWVPVKDEDLPVMQPYMEDYKPTDEGESPLARVKDWVNTTCPVCGGHAKRETDTMPQWAGSSWYYMRYLDQKNDKEFSSFEKMKKWLPVDHYNGGNEHNTRHLLYSRFWYKAMFDLGLVPTSEPYIKRTTNGLLLGKDGKKMSKSKGNGFLALDKVKEVGADVSRLSVLSLGPWDSNVIWSDGAQSGIQRFLKRIVKFSDNLTNTPLTKEEERLINQLIKDISERIEVMQFNTSISLMMEFINNFDSSMPRKVFETLLSVLNPFAPHITEELWEKLGNTNMLFEESWLKFDNSKLEKQTIKIVVSINGKRRCDFDADINSSKEELINTAKELVNKYLTENIKNTVFIPNKLINFVL